MFYESREQRLDSKETEPDQKADNVFAMPGYKKDALEGEAAEKKSLYAPRNKAEELHDLLSKDRANRLKKRGKLNYTPESETIARNEVADYLDRDDSNIEEQAEAEKQEQKRKAA